jgi:hypothetical protein
MSNDFSIMDKLLGNKDLNKNTRNTERHSEIQSRNVSTSNDQSSNFSDGEIRRETYRKIILTDVHICYIKQCQNIAWNTAEEEFDLQDALDNGFTEVPWLVNLLTHVKSREIWCN